MFIHIQCLGMIAQCFHEGMTEVMTISQVMPVTIVTEKIYCHYAFFSIIYVNLKKSKNAT